MNSQTVAAYGPEGEITQLLIKLKDPIRANKAGEIPLESFPQTYKPKTTNPEKVNLLRIVVNNWSLVKDYIEDRDRTWWHQEITAVVDEFPDAAASECVRLAEARIVNTTLEAVDGVGGPPLFSTLNNLARATLMRLKQAGINLNEKV